jgi:hypothetical protein
MELRVHKVAAAASGGSHVTIFEGDVQLAAAGVLVEIDRVNPADADPATIESAREAIRCGAEEVLTPLNTGAVIKVSRIVIHPVDFKPGEFERYTAEELRRLLEVRGDQA